MSPNADDAAADPDIERLKAALGHLAGSDDRTVIDRTEASIDDLQAAAAFVDEVGLDELERAIETTEDPELRARGERALSAFRRFRSAAACDSPVDHFHRGHDTDLRDAVEGSRQ